MATPRIPNQRKQYNKLNERLARYVLAVQSVYDELNKRAAQIGLQSGFDGEGEFRWADFPELRRKIEELQTDFVTDLGALIMRGTSEEWKNSNLLQDMIADKVIKTYTGTKDREAHTQYYQTNSPQLRAFQQRKDRGLNLSAKLWSQSEGYKETLEDVLSVAIERGTDAITLSKRISKYLRDFDSFKGDYTAKYGKATKVHDCEYRSIRLARSEINMAYRTAEQERWRQFDFVVGYEIKLSGAHPKEDICDRLAGKYPKDFVWTGFHPNDLCYCIPLLKTEDEFFAEEDKPASNEVTDVPPQFKEWCTENEERLYNAQKNKTLPYFIRDNSKYNAAIFGSASYLYKDVLKEQVEIILRQAHSVGDDFQSIAVDIAQKHGGIVTTINYKASESIERKCQVDKVNPEELRDIVRTTIVVHQEQIEEVLRELQDNPMFFRLKRQLPEDYSGYSGNIVNLRHQRNNMVGEIQVNTPQMIYAKEKESIARKILGDTLYERMKTETGMEGGLGHEYYEQIRVLNDTASVQRAQKIKLEREMAEYYSHFR